MVYPADVKQEGARYTRVNLGLGMFPVIPYISSPFFMQEY